MGTTPWKRNLLIEWWFHYGVKDGDLYPAVYVDWDDAVAFCRELSEKEGVEYRLPTEAE
jgi:formylglycine-generating enzyme required for sulfatase activity